MTDDADSRNVGRIAGALAMHDVPVARVLPDDHWYQLVADVGGDLYRLACKPTIEQPRETGEDAFKIYTTKEERRRLFEGAGPAPDAFCFADGVRVYWVPATEMNKQSKSLTRSSKHDVTDRANPAGMYELEVQLAAIRDATGETEE